MVDESDKQGFTASLDFKAEGYSGDEKGALESITQDLSTQMANTTGLQLDNPHIIAETTYDVTISVDGKESTGTHSDFAQALKNAADGRKYDASNIQVEASVEAVVPYFLKEVSITALTQEGFIQELDRAVQSESAIFEGRIDPEYESAAYHVMVTDRRYPNVGQIPDTIKSTKIKGQARSTESIDAAYTEAVKKAGGYTTGKKGKGKSVVFRGTVQLRVYGVDETSPSYSPPSVDAVATTTAVAETPTVEDKVDPAPDPKPDPKPERGSGRQYSERSNRRAHRAGSGAGPSPYKAPTLVTLV